MEYSKRPTLMSYLASEPTEYFSEKGLFRKRRITFYNTLTVCGYMYETGAILGRVRRDKLTTLVKILPVVAGQEDSCLLSLKEDAPKRLNQFKQEYKKEPDSFAEFILHQHQIENASAKTFGERTPLEKVYPFFERWGAGGIGFGSSFPELTRKMYKNPEVNFEERERLILRMVAAYTSEYYPELLDPLDLRRYLEI